MSSHLSGQAAAASLNSSLDHLVGASEQRRRHGEAESFRSLQVDHQFELRRLLDRQVRGLSPFEDLAGVVNEIAFLGWLP